MSAAMCSAQVPLTFSCVNMWTLMYRMHRLHLVSGLGCRQRPHACAMNSNSLRTRQSRHAALSLPRLSGSWQLWRLTMPLRGHSDGHACFW